MDVGPADQSPSIEIENLRAGYWDDRPVLTDFSLRLREPGLWHLAAPNGTGKSTVFEVLSGYLMASGGSVVVNGSSVVPGRRRSDVCVLRSTPELVPGLTLSDHVYLYAQRYGCPHQRLRQAGERLGLAKHWDKPPEDLSTGTLKKAWFVLGTAGKAAVLLLDEPFNGVDKDAAAAMVRITVERARSSLVVLTTHHVDLEWRLGATAVPEATRPPFVLSRLAFDPTG